MITPALIGVLASTNQNAANLFDLAVEDWIVFSASGITFNVEDNIIFDLSEP